MPYDDGGLSEWESRDLDFRIQQSKERYSDEKIKSLELEVEKLKQENKILNAEVVILNKKLNYKTPEEVMKNFFK